jgi:hypothetical protein
MVNNSICGHRKRLNRTPKFPGSKERNVEVRLDSTIDFTNPDDCATTKNEPAKAKSDLANKKITQNSSSISLTLSAKVKLI